MAKKQQSFAEKVAKQRGAKKNMAKLVISERKANGNYSFRTKMVEVDNLKQELAEAKS